MSMRKHPTKSGIQAGVCVHACFSDHSESQEALSYSYSHGWARHHACSATNKSSSPTTACHRFHTPPSLFSQTDVPWPPARGENIFSSRFKGGQAFSSSPNMHSRSMQQSAVGLDLIQPIWRHRAVVAKAIRVTIARPSPNERIGLRCWKRQRFTLIHLIRAWKSSLSRSEWTKRPG